MIATDPLSLVFIFCFLLGFGFFLAANLMGGHGHAGHVHVHVHMPGVHHAPVHTGGHAAHSATHAPNSHASNQTSSQQTPQQAHFSLAGYLNPTSIALFLLGFGFFGYFFHNLTPVAASLSLLLAIICGVVLAAALLALLSRIFANVESSTEQDVVDRTGMLGKVSITIPEKGLGEIIYTSPAGMRKSIPARGLNNQHLDSRSGSGGRELPAWRGGGRYLGTFHAWRDNWSRFRDSRRTGTFARLAGSDQIPTVWRC